MQDLTQIAIFLIPLILQLFLLLFICCLLVLFYRINRNTIYFTSVIHNDSFSQTSQFGLINTVVLLVENDKKYLLIEEETANNMFSLLSLWHSLSLYYIINKVPLVKRKENCIIYFNQLHQTDNVGKISMLFSLSVLLPSIYFYYLINLVNTGLPIIMKKLIISNSDVFFAKKMFLFYFFHEILQKVDDSLIISHKNNCFKK